MRQHFALLLTAHAAAVEAAAAAAAAATSTGRGVSRVARWVSATHALPSSNLVDVPLLGNGHVGVLLDTANSGLAAGFTSRDFTIREATSCGSYSEHSGRLCMGCTVSECKQHCTKDRRCAVFNWGAAGACNKSPQSCCFAEPDTSHCAPGFPNYTSGVRGPNPPAAAPKSPPAAAAKNPTAAAPKSPPAMTGQKLPTPESTPEPTPEYAKVLPQGRAVHPMSQRPPLAP